MARRRRALVGQQLRGRCQAYLGRSIDSDWPSACAGNGGGLQTLQRF